MFDMHLRDSEVESQSHGVGMQLLEEREADRNNSLLSAIHMSTAARECAQHDAASAVRARAAARHANEAPKLFAAQRLFESTHPPSEGRQQAWCAYQVIEGSERTMQQQAA
jgi:hypothetical protein